MIQHLRTNIAAAFHKAHNERIVGLTAEVRRALGLAGRRQFGFVGLDNLAQDLGYALRQMRRTPGLTALALLTLAFGPGAISVDYLITRWRKQEWKGAKL